MYLLFPTQDSTIARRLITVAMSDFLCWFPVGVLGLMATSGFPVPGEVNVAVAIFVLPLNSALNPFLYTLNVVLEKRARVREQRLKKMLIAEMKSGGKSQLASSADTKNSTLSTS